MSNEVGYIAPQGEMTGSFTAPQGTSQKTKKENLEILPQGPQPAVIFAVVDLGTHKESYMGGEPKDKKKIFIGLEFPQLKQVFYEDDNEVRSAAIFIESTFAMNDKAKLRKIVEAVCGRGMTDTEAYSYDVTKILGTRILVNVGHNVSKKNGKTYAAADGFMPLGQYPLPVPFDPINDYWSFYGDPSGNNYKTMNFAKLPGFLKKKVIDSNEGKAYISSGGMFAKMPNNSDSQRQANPNDSQNQTPKQAQPPQQPTSNAGLVMLVSDFTYEQYKASGWTDEVLIQHGKAKKAEPVAPPTMPQAPQGPPSAPQSPSTPPVQNQGGGSPFDDDDSDLPF